MLYWSWGMLLCHDEQRFIVLDLMTYQLFLFCFLLLYMEIWCIIIKKKFMNFCIMNSTHPLIWINPVMTEFLLSLSSFREFSTMVMLREDAFKKWVFQFCKFYSRYLAKSVHRYAALCTKNSLSMIQFTVRLFLGCFILIFSDIMTFR